MLTMNDFTHTDINESGICECCGNATLLLVSDLQADGKSYCDYSIRWTKGREMDPWGIFLVTFDGEKNIGISIEYRAMENAFMIANSDRFSWPKEMLKKEIIFAEREDLIGTPIANWIFQILDYLWANEKLPLERN